MESLARPLRALQEEMAGFVRAGELRLLLVHTDAPLRSAALALVMSHAYHADNRGLFLRFDQEADGTAGAWRRRSARLRESWGAQAHALRAAGVSLPDLDAPDEQNGAAAFGALLAQAARRLRPPLGELVVVLAPVTAPRGEELARVVATLARAPELASVRWVLVETDAPSLRLLTGALQDRAAAVDCLTDEQAQRADLAALATGDGAHPDSQPPPRRGAAGAASDRALRDAGVAPALSTGAGAELRRLVLAAALALREGRHADAVASQRRAAALCGELGLRREQALNLHVLGGYLLAAGATERAAETYANAGVVAHACEDAELEAQSALALGVLEATRGAPARAAVHYADAARLAEAAGSAALAIECWRVAGQLAADTRLEQAAVRCWQRALAVAGEMPAAAARVSSAPEVARGLAAVCRRAGLAAQAQSLEGAACAFEAGEPQRAGGASRKAFSSFSRS